MNTEHSKLGLIVRGVAMGIAEIIPGVSGGTIAFITGIYETLIASIKALGPEAISGYKENGVAGVWKAVNGNFLLWLLLGMVGGIAVGIVGVTYLLEHYPEPLWAFFFGLILASAGYMATQVEKWSVFNAVLLAAGAIVAYLLTTLSPSEGSLHPLYLFVSGAIAISALMLPGISGSFILLIMGMYTVVIRLVRDTVEHQDLAGIVALGIFGLGCLTGLAGFSRVLSWLFDKYKEPTFAVLTGFLIGALNKVWPWRNIETVLDKETGELIVVNPEMLTQGLSKETTKIVTEVNVLPAEYWAGSPMVIVCIFTFALGIGLVYFLAKNEKR